MNDAIRELTAMQLLDTVESFDKAVHEAGGAHIGVDAMRNMTLFHFICHVAAPNGTRFRLNKQE